MSTIFYSESKEVRLACNLDLILEDKGLQEAIHKKDGGMGIMTYVEEGGGCSTPQKVRNMEQAGAQAVLIAGFF